MTTKILTKRFGKQNPIEEMGQLQELFNEIKNSILVPKGVHKFKSYEEANEWMIKTMASTHVSQNSKTS